ncbi:MAG: sigma 54-interacting transcriptional regulator [Deltaproteobacteria bacterium]|nr:sigma 54-interacting transcriptional regulator [Deltaproteobacteria bacterium]
MSKESDKTVGSNLSHHSGGPNSASNNSSQRSSARSEGDSNRCGAACRLLLDSIREPMCLVNHEGHVIESNAEAFDLFGLKRNHLITDVFPALAPDAILDKTRNMFADIIQEPRIFQKHIDFQGRRYQGTCIPVATTGDKIDGVSIAFRDVTAKKVEEKLPVNIYNGLDPRLERQTLELAETNHLLELEVAERLRAENQLKQINKLYQTVVETSKDVISTMTLDLKYTYVSSSVVNALGYTPEEMLKLNALELMTPESRHGIVTSLRDWLEKGSSGKDPAQNSRTEEAQQYMKNGQIRWAEITGTFLRDETGKAYGIVTTSRDITDRKRLESELQDSLRLLEQRVRERTADLESINEKLMQEISQRRATEHKLLDSEKRFEAMFQGAQDCVFLKDTNLKITHVNPAMLELTRKPLSAFIGKTFEKVFGSDRAVSIRDADLKTLNGETVETEFSLKVSDRLITFSCVRFPIRDGAGAVVGICGILRDITDRKAHTSKKPPFQIKSLSPIFRDTLRELALVAGTDSTVLFLGESGVGKDYLAKFLHEKSRRAGSPFFAVNCAALPPSLAESELFGHEQGSFTGSLSRKRGLLELAESGTLLLNEIGDLPTNLQAKLLTFLDTQSFTRVGGSKLIKINARILAATNKNLADEVKSGNFRTDLFFRLNVFTITVPPLRDRIEDLPSICGNLLTDLSQKFGLSRIPAIRSGAMKKLALYDWPGNIRELRNVLERALIISEQSDITEEHIIGMVHGSTSKSPSAFPGSKGTNEQVSMSDAIIDLKKSLIEETLLKCNGNVTRAAELLGMTRNSLKHQMKKNTIKRKN